MGVNIKGGFATDAGLRDSINQDAILLRALEQNGEWFVAGVVCDGIGGLERGEDASRLVIGAFDEWFRGICQWIRIDTIDFNALLQHATEAIKQWNKKVRQFCEGENIKSGTTMSMLVLIRGYYFILHVGDSRVYCYNQLLTQLTIDDTARKLVNGRERDLLSNFLGKSDELKYKVYTGEIKKGDIFIFCSDGFYRNLAPQDLNPCITKYQSGMSVRQICVDAINLMKMRQEQDNISVGIIFTEHTKRGLFR